jgi:hypothetical protein
MYRALDAIGKRLMAANNPLENAANADALCMVLKKTEDQHKWYVNICCIVHG